MPEKNKDVEGREVYGDDLRYALFY